MKLHYAGTPGSGYGWGTCNAHLIEELGKRCELTGPDGADVVFMPLADHSFNPATPARGKVNLAYAFFEFPLQPMAIVNAAKYDAVFCGSTWCLDRMFDAGIGNGEVLIQGVDTGIFKPGERKPDGQFRIFSGGKFEYRKGQDLVIAAFKVFHREHPGAHLVCSWFNPWPALEIDLLNRMGAPCPWDINPAQLTILPQLTHPMLAREMANTDCGLFPNRCEGGTNLVLMEYAATGGVVVANALTGHADVRDMIDVVIEAGEDEMKWARQSVEDIVRALESASEGRGRVKKMCIPTWENAAKQILRKAEELLKV